MTPIDGHPILTVAQMRAAEDRAIANGATVERLMERAGAGVAEAVRRLAAGAPVLMLCGPGNNGGDGYVAARVLRANGMTVRVAALGEPKTEAAIAARAAWGGAIEPFPAALPDDAAYAPVVVDAVFGTGLTRPVADSTMSAIDALVRHASLSIAVDLPSGVDTDLATEWNGLGVPAYTLTLALGAPKPAHVLQPAAERCGTVRVIDIGLDLTEQSTAMPDRTMRRPSFVPAPRVSDYKYSRGLVVVIGGDMPGAAALAGEAALHAGAGYVLALGDGDAAATPHAMVRRRWSADALASATHGKRRDRTVIVVGPGLGKDGSARAKLDMAMDSGFPVVIDGDALHMLDDAAFARFRQRAGSGKVVLTPHAGEFAALFGAPSGNKIEAARDAALRSGATVVFKGPDTVIAHPDGTTVTATGASSWLSTAGTGDVLAGTIATMLAAMPSQPVEAAVWMHAEAARRLGGAFLADDLARSLSAVRAAL